MIDSFGLASSAMARVVALPDAAPVVAPEKCYNFHKRDAMLNAHREIARLSAIFFTDCLFLTEGS